MPTIKGKWGLGRPGETDSLGAHIAWYVKEQDYVVVSQMETSAQLVKPKQFSLGWAFLWLMMAGVGIFVYIFYYIAKSDGAIYLYVEDGKVLRR